MSGGGKGGGRGWGGGFVGVIILSISMPDSPPRPPPPVTVVWDCVWLSQKDASVHRPQRLLYIEWGLLMRKILA